MDHIIFNSWLFRGLISRFITKTVRVKFGTDAKISIDKFWLSHKNGRTKMYIGVEVDASDEDIITFAKGVDKE